MPEPTARAALYNRLADVLGVDHAGVLMSYLPGDEPATKTDIVAVKEDIVDLKDRMDRFEERMERFDAKLDGFKDILLAQGKFYTGSMVSALIALVAITQLLN